MHLLTRLLGWPSITWRSWLNMRHSAHIGASKKSISDFLQVHPSVQSALNEDGALVALESTIITHGMPHPHNLRTAQEVEKLVIQTGATPATIAVLDGKICVGLTDSQLQGLATTQHAVKTSRRDLAWVLSQKFSGGTTVSGTMIAAHLAGIPIFVTGGIGGVHRGGETSMDVSADLQELGRTPVTVVSAGIKSILDIPRTLEYLETQGVTVATYGSSSEFPAFFTRHSGVKSPCNIGTAREAAELIDTNLSLGLGSGVLIGVPIPEEYAADGEMIEGAIQTALSEANNEGIGGKEVTPFILSRVNALTQGKSLEANIALVKNNAKVGSKIALELAAIRRKRRGNRLSSNIPHITKRDYSTYAVRHRSRRNVRRHLCTSSASPPVVIGASIVDHTASCHGGELVYGGQTNRGSFRIGYGGVGRNLADALTRLGASPIFLSAIGNDFAGQALRNNCSHMDFSRVSLRDDVNTASYCVVLDKKGEVVLGIGDMDINDTITPEYISQHASVIQEAPVVCMDGNIPSESIEFISRLCADSRVPLWFEPTCVMKAMKVCQSDTWKSLTYTSPNFKELRQMYAAIEGEETINFQDDQSFTDKVRECLQLSRVLLRHIYCLFITLGEDGILICRNAEPDQNFVISKQGLQDIEMDGMFSAMHYTVSSNIGQITSVSGAGDCLAAASIANMLRGNDPDVCLRAGLLAAQHSLQSHHAVPPSITSELLSPDFVLDHVTVDPSRLQ
ncbi:pseudouridine-metabolizing bifunctional protein C1861.05-like isoform X1 [Lytechinus variegatus]|uniref:pseudouridine-metabolizing bifunctional protein C1861.05-like isoform X1 n=1 Tax=Lytechinus variegatus TaxID=7654 RepID=UPI001BB18B80|nr:pseudouridine-metabolizing bifunctional protein C1861.05-like isoform X1 [Lytechinus variegatus]XP_041474987.1 pseudouridine-metabolizing bifunctional protein C1861.05-like isoform X1 [Lytechinus variegatus]